MKLEFHRIIDITRPLAPQTPVYPGDPPVELTTHASLAAGDPYQLTSLRLGLHAGTHLDAPAHFIHGGVDIGGLAPVRFILPAWIIDVEGDVILPESLPASLASSSAILFRTRHSRGPQLAFESDHAHLAPETARRLIELDCQLVGIDTFDVDVPGDSAYPIHHALLSAGILILENLDLARAPAGPAMLIVLPLLIPRAEAAPARALLLA